MPNYVSPKRTSRREVKIVTAWSVRDVEMIGDVEEMVAGPDAVADLNVKDIRSFMALNGNTIAMAVVSDVAIGHMMFTERPGGYRIARIAVDPDHQRTGAGSLLIRHLKTKLVPARPKIVADVPETNDPAVAFFSGRGFEASLVRRRSGLRDDYRFVFRRELQNSQSTA